MIGAILGGVSLGAALAWLLGGAKGAKGGSVSHPYVEDFRAAARVAGVPEVWATDPDLVELVRRESNWNLTAKNPGSSAFGLFQLIKATWREYLPEVPYGTADALWQAVGGFRYVRARYANPARALAFQRATVAHRPELAPADLRERAATWIAGGWAGY